MRRKCVPTATKLWKVGVGKGKSKRLKIFFQYLLVPLVVLEFPAYVIAAMIVGRFFNDAAGQHDDILVPKKAAL